MFTKEIALPSAEELKKELPLLEAQKRQRESCISQIEDVLSGKSDKLLMIAGPCSAHESDSVLEFVSRLAHLNDKVKEKLVLIPRIFTDKPRTRGVGYKGMLSHPDPAQGENYQTGLRKVRNLHLKVLQESGLISADEMLSPEDYEYTSDVVGYTVIGARTSEAPQHRMYASGLDTPVGIKNPMSGSIPALVSSVYASQQSQRFLFHGYQLRTDGNAYAHAILRGRVNEHGEDVSNYDKKTVEALCEGFHRSKIQNSSVIIDCNHSNSAKKCECQPLIAKEVLKLRQESEIYRGLVKGFMVESFLQSGSEPSGSEYGKSITDPCLGWEETERLILEIAERV